MRLLCLALLALALMPADALAQQKKTRPNLILLLTDDQRADCLGCQKHPLLKTPHIDALAKQGVLFDNAFVTTAICCVSRASIVTGRYARKHRVPDFATPLQKDVLAESFL